LLFALEFPPISHLVEWPDFLFKGNAYLAFNKITLLMLLSSVFTLALFFLAGNKAKLVPTGVQNVAEAGVEFVRDNILVQTMGPHALSWLPFLTTIFFFVLFNNLWEVIPGIQMPVNARMAVPVLLAVMVWCVYHFQGIKHQGLPKYVKNALIPPGVPAAFLPLVVFIELLTVLILQPFSLAVRLFANMLAGHLLLVTFAVLSAALFTKSVVAIILPLPAVMLVLLTAFEIFVAGMQAFIFTMLTAVYIGAAQSAEH
jgi:F-type H+-transporting ATPase subunit a